MDLDHKHIIGSAAVRKPFTDVDATVDWFRRLIEAVDMKIVIGPFAHYCTADENEGIAGVTAIETSHASLHIWDKVEVPFAKFDLYSCQQFNTGSVIKMVMELDPYWYEYVVIDRNLSTKIVARYSEQVVPVKSLLPDAEELVLNVALTKKHHERSADERKVVTKYNKLRKLYELKS